MRNQNSHDLIDMRLRGLSCKNCIYVELRVSISGEVEYARCVFISVWGLPKGEVCKKHEQLPSGKSWHW